MTIFAYTSLTCDTRGNFGRRNKYTSPTSCIYTTCLLRMPTPVNSPTLIAVVKPVHTLSEPVSEKSLQDKKSNHKRKLSVETHSTLLTSEVTVNPPLKLQKTQPFTSMEENNVQPPTPVQGDLSKGNVSCPVILVRPIAYLPETTSVTWYPPSLLQIVTRPTLDLAEKTHHVSLAICKPKF